MESLEHYLDPLHWYPAIPNPSIPHECPADPELGGWFLTPRWHIAEATIGTIITLILVYASSSGPAVRLLILGERFHLLTLIFIIVCLDIITI